MKSLFAVLGTLAVIGAAAAISSAESVMHEIFGAGLGTMGAVFLIGAGIISAIEGIPESQLRHEVARASAATAHHHQQMQQQQHRVG